MADDDGDEICPDVDSLLHHSFADLTNTDATDDRVATNGYPLKMQPKMVTSMDIT